MLFSFGAFLTLCRIQRNNAEQRVAAMRAKGWKAETLAAPAKAATATIGRELVDKQLGAMTKFNAAQGLFVAWGGFKGNVQIAVLPPAPPMDAEGAPRTAVRAVRTPGRRPQGEVGVDGGIAR